MDLPPNQGDPGQGSLPFWVSVDGLDSTVLFGLWEREGESWHWALRSQLFPISFQVSYLLQDPTLAGGAASARAGDTKDESLGGLCWPLGLEGEGLSGASFLKAALAAALRNRKP